MTLSMYDVSVPVFTAGLNASAKLLAKVKDEAPALKVDESNLLNARLAPDMFSLTKQVQTLSDIAKAAVCRLAGIEIPSYPDAENSFAELGARLDRTIDFIATIRAEQIDGSEEREVVLQLGGNPVTFTGQSYLLGFATPNFYFHRTAIYAILRHNGFQIGKRDYLGR